MLVPKPETIKYSDRPLDNAVIVAFDRLFHDHSQDCYSVRISVPIGKEFLGNGILYLRWLLLSKNELCRYNPSFKFVYIKREIIVSNRQSGSGNERG